MTKRASLSQSMAQLATNRSGKLSTGGTTVGETTHRGRINSVNSNLGGLEPEVGAIDRSTDATTTTTNRSTTPSPLIEAPIYPPLI